MDKTLRVCMIGYGIHPPWNEGCAIIARDLALALRNHVKVFTISAIDCSRNFTKINFKQSTKVTNYVSSNSIFRASRYKGKYLMPDQLLDAGKIYFMLKHLDSQYHIDIVHVYNISHTVMSTLTKLFSKKSIVVHIFGPSDIGDIIAQNFIDAYVCTSELGYSSLINKGLSKQKVHVIPPIIDCSGYRPLEKSSDYSKLSTSNNPFIITYIGNVGPKRLPSELIMNIPKLANRRNKLELHVYCPDTLSNRENAMSLKMVLSKSKIKYRIVVSNLREAEKIQIYNTSDALIFPYTRETVIVDPPLAILESMACGKIVIASRILSIPNIIQHGENGFLVDPGDFEGFMDAIKSVINDHHKLERVRANARKTIQKHFSSDVVTNQIMDVYRSILNHESQAP